MSLSQERQAGVEIQITSAMVRAGVGAMLEYYSDDLQTESESVVTSVFRAMLAASHESPVPR